MDKQQRGTMQDGTPHHTGARLEILVSIAGGDADLMLDSVSSKGFTVAHSDGSYTEFRGSGISIEWLNFDPASATGQITSLRHYDWTGTLIDKVTNFNLPTSQVHYAIHHGFWLYGPLSGDDLIRSPSAGSTPVVDDTIIAGLGDDTVFAGSGDDSVDGSFGDDKLHGQAGNDSLRGDTDEFQTVTWRNGNDVLIGGTGDDTLYGGVGNDMLLGGKGSDTALFDEAFVELTITLNGTNFSVMSASGTDKMKGVERIQTSDGIYSWNASQQAWLQDTGEILI